MATTVSDLKNAQKKFDNLAKTFKGADIKEIVSTASKHSGALMKACTAWDDALKSKDAKKVRDAYSDLENTLKASGAKFMAFNLKAQKAKSEDAAELATVMVSGVELIKQSANGQYTDFTDKLDKAAKSFLPSTSFYGDWAAAKRVFEGMTGKKKPAPKFMLAFRSSTGLETATKAMDDAAKANDVDKFAKAIEAYKKTGREYLQFVSKEAKVAIGEHDTDIPDESDQEFDYKQSVEILLKHLNVIRLKAEKILADAK